jgi:hypothetical protein
MLAALITGFCIGRISAGKTANDQGRSLSPIQGQPTVPGAMIADFRQLQDILTLVKDGDAVHPPADFRVVIPQRVGMYFSDEKEVERLSGAIIETAQLIADGSFEDWKALLDRQRRPLPKVAKSETDAEMLWQTGQQLFHGGRLNLHATKVYLRRQRGVSVKTPVDYFDSYLFRSESWRDEEEKMMFFDMNVPIVDVSISAMFSNDQAQTPAQPGRLVFKLARRPSDGEWIVCEVGLTGVIDQLEGKIPIF